MAAVLPQDSQQLQVYQQGADIPDKLTSSASGEQFIKVHGKGNLGQSRAAWIEAVEDKENVDPASGLTVTTRRQRRRLVAAPAADLETLAGPASKGLRQPLTDLTPSFPQAIVSQPSSLPDKPA